MMWKFFKEGTASSEFLRSLLKGYANIFFLREPIYGGAILLLTLVQPNIGMAGLVAALSVLIFCQLTTGQTQSLQNDLYLCNVVLFGCFMGYQFKLDGAGVTLIVIGSLATLATVFLLSAFLSPHKIPVLSLPFSIVGCLTILAVPRYLNLFKMVNYWPNGPALIGLEQDNIINIFFNSFASTMAIPNAWVGIAAVAIVLIRSRIAVIVGVFSFLVSQVIEGCLTSPAVIALHNTYGYNDVMTGIALGCVFLFPSIRAVLAIVFGVCLCAIMGDALDAWLRIYQVPVLTLPFSLSVELTLLLLSWMGYRGFVQNWEGTAEKAVEKHILHVERFHGDRVQLGNPVSGSWQISQGKNGTITHKPPWQFALDFVGTDSNGSSHRGDGLILEDYYAYQRPVYSPVNGYVIDVFHTLADNPAGVVDHAHPWGNFIVLKTLDGFYVEISHLQKGSVRVNIGAYVGEGTLIACVGNSGNSPEPHLHLQVQLVPYVGAASIPFAFVAYMKNKQIYYGTCPSEGDPIEMWLPNPQLEQALSFVLSRELKYQEHRLVTEMEPYTGALCLHDEKGNKLYFSKNRSFFCFYDYVGQRNSFLRELYAAMPRVPFSGGSRVGWEDVLPHSLAYSHKVTWLINSLSVFSTRLFIRKGKFVFYDEFRIVGESYLDGQKVHTEVLLDPRSGIVHFRVGSKMWELETASLNEEASLVGSKA